MITGIVMPKIPDLAESKSMDDSIDMLNAKCISLAQEGKHGEAISCYDEMMKSSGPSYGIANFMKGSVLIGLGEYIRALECFAESEKTFPDDPDAKICKAICNVRLMRKNEALRCINEALSAAPTEVRILVVASILSFELDDNKKGEEYIKRAMDINPYSTYEYWEMAAKGYLDSKDADSSDKKEIKDLITQNKSLLKERKKQEEAARKKK